MNGRKGGRLTDSHATANAPAASTITRLTSSTRRLGLLYLAFNIVMAVTAQFILKAAMTDIAEFDSSVGVFGFLSSLLSWELLLGLAIYGASVVFWLMCLSKLELSYAYPAATTQHILIFLGAWLLFGEGISLLRLLGLSVVLLGVFVIATEPIHERH